MSLSFPSLCSTIRGSATQLARSICAILKSSKQKQMVVGSNNLIGPMLWVVCSDISLACGMIGWSLWWGCVEIACACVSIFVHWIVFIICHLAGAHVWGPSRWWGDKALVVNSSCKKSHGALVALWKTVRRGRWRAARCKLASVLIFCVIAVVATGL